MLRVEWRIRQTFTLFYRFEYFIIWVKKKTTYPHHSSPHFEGHNSRKCENQLHFYLTKRICHHVFQKKKLHWYFPAISSVNRLSRISLMFCLAVYLDCFPVGLWTILYIHFRKSLRKLENTIGACLRSKWMCVWNVQFVNQLSITIMIQLHIWKR